MRPSVAAEAAAADRAKRRKNNQFTPRLCSLNSETRKVQRPPSRVSFPLCGGFFVLTPSIRFHAARNVPRQRASVYLTQRSLNIEHEELRVQEGRSPERSIGPGMLSRVTVQLVFLCKRVDLRTYSASRLRSCPLFSMQRFVMKQPHTT